MSLAVAVFVLLTTLVTSTLSGVFGMAGGLILMGALALVLPVSAAFVAHGLIQIVANGGRAVLHRRHVRWDIVGWYALASTVAGLLVAVLSYVPSKPLLYLLLGLVPGLVWLPKERVALDAARPVHAFVSGLLVTGLNLLAGVAGPLLDIFFVRTVLTRHQIVATKAATQVFSHLAKVVVYGGPLLAAGNTQALPPWLLLAAAPLSVVGTVLGGRILDRMTDKSFLVWTRWIVTGIGVVYLIQAAQLYGS
jgi:uncharacterized membrane protein YfcA